MHLNLWPKREDEDYIRYIILHSLTLIYIFIIHMIKHILHLIFLSSYLSLAFAHRLSDMPDSFDYISSIDPSIIIQPRYAIPGNFVGEVVDGYRAKTAVISKLAGYALTNVQS